MPGTFYPSPRISDPDMHHGTCVTHVPWCMPGSLTSSFLWSGWRGKRSRHFRRKRNPHFCVSGKRPMDAPGTQRCIPSQAVVVGWGWSCGGHKQTNEFVKGIKNGLHTLCRSEAHCLCFGWRPCTSRWRVQGRSLGTTLSASDLHNARATIRNPFCDMNCKKVRKQLKKGWIQEDIPYVDFTPNCCNEIAPAIVYLNNDVTMPVNSMNSILNTITEQEPFCKRAWMRPKSFRN